ncbi:MAG: hypothetical protein U0Z53_23705 [Blastocatellia bacterium]
MSYFLFEQCDQPGDIRLLVGREQIESVNFCALARDERPARGVVTVAR